MITIGIVGLGNWGFNLLRALSEAKNVNIVSCCDRNHARFAQGVRFAPNALFTKDFNDLIFNKRIDAVVIATNAVSHYTLAKKAIERHKHVFVEKPLALNVRDASALVSLAKKKKIKLMVGHLLEYHPAIEKIKDLILKNELGKIYYIYSKRVNLGVIRNDENVLWSLAPHDISIANYLLGQVPVKVKAFGHSYIQKGIEDVVFVNLQMPGNIFVHIHNSWLDPLKMRRLTIVGSRKMVVFDDMESSEKLKIYDKGFKPAAEGPSYNPTSLVARVGDVVAPKIDLSEPLKRECEHFISCILDDKAPRSDGMDGLRVVKALAAAQRSLNNNGRWVKV